MNDKLYAMAILLASALIAGCGGSSTGADGDVDGDDDRFEYAACADPAARYIFPHPGWERPAGTLTGVALAEPSGDAAAGLLAGDRSRSGWLDSFPALDGFPLMASWMIPLDGTPLATDAGQVRLFGWKGGAIDEIGLEGVGAALFEDGYLLLEVGRPLPRPAAGERYVLALYEGAVEGALPLPACGPGGTAAGPFVEAASALAGAGHGTGLVLALPFTPSRAPETMAAVYEHLRQSPDASLLDSGAIDLDALETVNVPDAATRAALAEPAVEGVLSLPAYQDGEGRFGVDPATGMPAVQGRTEPGFVLALPRFGTAPHPFVLFQHGGGRNPYDLFRIARPYLEHGIALLGIDLPYHGHREVAGVDGMMEMVDFDRPLRSRDNFRQAAADHLAVLSGIGRINAALAPLTGLNAALDPERAFLIGHSMGSISGTISSGTAAHLGGMTLIAGGAPYRQLLADGMFTFFLTSIFERPPLEQKLLMAMLQALMDGGDPINYGLSAEDQSRDPRDALVFEVIGDPVANNRATDWQAHAFGTGLLAPFNHEVPGMIPTPAPVAGNFAWTAGGATATRLLFQFERPDLGMGDLHMGIFLDPRVHEVSAACFAGRLDGSGCEIPLPR